MSLFITLANNWFFKNKTSEVEFVTYIGDNDDGLKLWNHLNDTYVIKDGKIDQSAGRNLASLDGYEYYDEQIKKYFRSKNNIFHNIIPVTIISFFVGFLTGCALSLYD